MSKRKRTADNESIKQYESSLNVDINDETDKGHRYGNFSNYYTFHPPNERINIMSQEDGVFDIIKQHVASSNNDDCFTYMDIGCNQGDLTLAVANELRKKCLSEATQLQVTGIDIDPVLVNRAQELYKSTGHQQPNTTCDFITANMLSCQLPTTADFTTLFSTTMWIHIHGGDDGLKQAMIKIAASTRQFLLVEAQPSKCYRNAATRLRRMGVDKSIDVSQERLTWRANVDEYIDQIIVSDECGFIKVQVDGGKTSWARHIQLYKRVNTTSTTATTKKATAGKVDITNRK